MASPVSLVIHLVGLFLLSNQVPNDCGIKAIAPKEVYIDPRTPLAASASVPSGVTKTASAGATNEHLTVTKTAVLVPIGPAPHVEDHVTLLVFPADSYVGSTNWGIRTLLPGFNPNTYQYVTLDGERIRFDAGIPNQVASLANIKLPPLHGLCPSMNSLNANFQPPYSGAAAVFDLPQGDVNACMTGNQQRIDTEINLQSSGFLTISASTMRVPKEIRLKPSATTGKFELIVANVPVNCLTNGFCSPPIQNALDSVTHVHAYYAMGDGQSAACNTSITAWFQANQTNPSLIPSNTCTVAIPDAAGGFGMAGMRQTNGHPGTIMATDFECSNSSWP